MESHRDEGREREIRDRRKRVSTEENSRLRKNTETGKAWVERDQREKRRTERLMQREGNTNTQTERERKRKFKTDKSVFVGI